MLLSAVVRKYLKPYEIVGGTPFTIHAIGFYFFQVPLQYHALPIQ